MLPDNLDIKKLKAFQLVARHGNLRVVASQLGLTIPAVSIQIRRLEEELGIELFLRLPTGLVLTAAGEHLAHELSGIFEKIEVALATMPSRKSSRGQLSIATSGDVASYFAPRIGTFIKQYPEVRLHYSVYHSSEIVARMKRGDLDVGIGYFSPPPKFLEREVIAQTSHSLIGGAKHELLRRNPPRLNDIARHKLILLSPHYKSRKIIDSVFSKAKIKLDNVIEVGNCHTAYDFAKRGVGVAIVHSICMGKKPSRGLRYIDLGNQFGRVEFSVIYRKNFRANPAVTSFLETLMSRRTDDHH